MGQFLTDRDEIKAWLDEMGVERYSINDDLTVDVNGFVNLENKELRFLPVQFGTVDGFFDCGTNWLTSLLGCPVSVDEWFSCQHNVLTSLEHCPRTVVGMFHCDNNKLASLDFLPESIGDTLFVNSNPRVRNILAVLLVEYLPDISFDPYRLQKIIDKHLEGDRDIFACQQELIEKGFEEYAQL